jgi:hypothetical protein
MTRQRTTLHEKHAAMLKAQRDNDGFDLRLVDLMTVWGYRSKNTVLYHLRRLHAAGLVTMHEHGHVCKWRAMEANYGT